MCVVYPKGKQLGAKTLRIDGKDIGGKCSELLCTKELMGFTAACKIV